MSRRGGWFRGIWFIVPLVALWVIPILVFLYVLPAAGKQEQSALDTQTPETTVVGSVEQDYRRSVVVDIERRQGIEVLSPTSGVVNAVHIEPGATLVTGSQLLTVGGAPLFAVVDVAPLYRPISLEDSGDDVATMCAVLHRVGVWGPGSCTTVSESVESAIEAFEKRYGLEESGVFRPEYTVYVRADAGAVGSVLVSRGDNADPSTPILQMASQVISTKIKAADDSAGLADFADQPVTLTIGTKSLDLKSVKPTKRQRAKLTKLVTKQVAKGTVQAEEDPDAGVTTYSGQLILKLTEPATVATVPASAIYPTTSGKMCIFTPSSASGGQAEPVPVDYVEDLTSPIGSVGVDTSLIGTTVVTDVSTLSWDTVNQCE